MAADVKTIRCNFIGDFKVGDNILANGNALCRLSATNENNTFNKLMVVQAGSIVEAALDQIIYRAQNYTKEGRRSQHSGGRSEDDSRNQDRAVQQHYSGNEDSQASRWPWRNYLR